MPNGRTLFTLDQISTKPDISASTRLRLEAMYGRVWSQAELAPEFEVLGFGGHFVVVRRKSDGSRGSLEFQHRPRLYFNLVFDE
jgi:hypothetical protein